MTKTNSQAALLLVGLGDLGGRIASLAQQADIKVIGMRRGTQTPAGVQLLQHDASTPWPAVAEPIADLLLCLSPDNRSPAAYQQAYCQVAEQALYWWQQQAKPPHIWLISSTSVYGQQQGEWVDEQSPRQPLTDTARLLVQTEQRYLQSSAPVTILRPSGLYGPGRTYLLRQAQATVPDTKPPADDHYTNRIHITDAARAVVHLLQLRRRGATLADSYNLSDTQPATLQQVLCFIRQQLLAQPPAEAPLATELGGKRISSARLAASGFVWHYQDYRSGYLSMLNSN